MNKPVGMLVGGSGVVLCKLLVGGTCVAVAWVSGGGLDSAIIGTVPSWEAGGMIDAHLWLAYVWDRATYNWQPV